MIHSIAGKLRSGKGLYVIKRILEQLIETERFIVTNMVLRVELIQDYLDERGHNIHARDRILMLNDEQMKDFWLYQEFGVILPKCEDYDSSKADTNVDYSPLFTDPRFRVGGKLELPDGSTAPHRGVCYVFDEIHNVYPSRQWQGTPRHFTFFCSQHGKLNCICFFTTQSLKNCDPVTYRLTQDFTYTRNHSVEKFGIFRGDPKFTAKTYLSALTNDNQIPMGPPVSFKLDMAQAALYDTSAGVGMPGGGVADQKTRAKGVPMKALWVGLAAVIVFVWFGITKGTPALARSLGSGSSKALASTSSTLGVSTPAPVVERSVPVVPLAQAAPFEVPRVEPAPSPVVAENRPERPLVVRGYVVNEATGKANIILSDGRTLTERDKEWSGLGRNGVTVAGRKIWMATPEPREVSVKPVAVVHQEEKGTGGDSYRGEALFDASPGLGRIDSSPSQQQGRRAVPLSGVR